MKFVKSTVCFASVSCLVLAVLVPVLHLVMQNFTCFSGNHSSILKQHGTRTVVIGILSAREHFEERQAIRDTWVQDITHDGISEKVLYKFVIGSKACDLPPKNRKDPYSCEQLNFTYDQNVDHQNLQLVSLKEDRGQDLSFSKYDIIWNASVVVRYPVVVRRLGLHAAVQLSWQPVVVELYDENTEEVVMSAKFSTIDPGIVDSTKADEVNYRFQSVTQVLLPEGYECSLRVLIHEDRNIINIQNLTKIVSINNSGGTLDLMPINEKGFYIHRKTKNGVFIGNVIFAINDLDRFKQIQEDQSHLDAEFQSVQNNITSKLNLEKATYNDIVFVNLTDTYRNLPLKLLYFHQWVQSELHTKFVLKTDDDCFVNIKKILSELHALEEKSKVWFGHFRDSWYVERFGKWAEKMYRASEYPSFACGSGNIVSNDISDWLARNAETLFPYQGEDTSIGIWLSAIGPTIIENQDWLCEKGCKNNALVIPQLAVKEMKLMWKNKQDCDNICGCT